MPITKLTSGLPSRSMVQAVFDAATETLMSELPTWGAEASALEDNVNTKEASAVEAAAIAVAKAGEVVTAADIATGAAEAAQAAAETAVNVATGFLAVSATTNTVGTGLKTYAVGADKLFFRGMFVVAVSATDMTRYITGQVDSYSAGNLIINGEALGGAGASVSNWVIGPSGSRGAPGPVGSLAGTNLTGPLNAARAADVASALTIDIWSGAGNFMVLTGNEPIASVGTAPQPGAARDILVAGHPILLSSATLSIKGVRAGRTLVLAPGDELSVVAQTVSIIRITVTRADGSSPSDRSRTHSALLSF